MIISTCSFGSTGSSVITDYLKEFNNIKVLDKVEIPWISAVDGIIDLEYHLNNPHGRTMNSICAIERYRQLFKRKMTSFEKLGVSKDVLQRSLDEFIDAITMASWMWYAPKLTPDSIAKTFVIKLLKRSHLISKWQLKNHLQWEGFPYSRVYFAVRPDNFMEAARKHVKDVLDALGANANTILVFDQLFPGNNPQGCFDYFDDPYAIVVDRDPRDIYVFGKTYLLRNDAGHIMPLNDVKDFVTYYRALRKGQPYKDPNKRILEMRFEDLVYNYDESTARLRDFLHLGDNPNPKSIFDPSLSIANTQVWKRYPEFSQDIEYIEKELPEYLFDFSDYSGPDMHAKMFSGKSPKNK